MPRRSSARTWSPPGLTWHAMARGRLGTQMAGHHPWPRRTVHPPCPCYRPQPPQRRRARGRAPLPSARRPTAARAANPSCNRIGRAGTCTSRRNRKSLCPYSPYKCRAGSRTATSRGSGRAHARGRGRCSPGCRTTRPCPCTDGTHLRHGRSCCRQRQYRHHPPTSSARPRTAPARRGRAQCPVRSSQSPYCRTPRCAHPKRAPAPSGESP
mmetsp:Transcript_37851/g.100117  ORF Transcript_37851/g.100117 Transcript_37851/m.100117 type:complete len:211 (-) Transcript_37851:140-772(-)